MYNKMSPQLIADLKMKTLNWKFSYNTIEKERERRNPYMARYIFHYICLTTIFLFRHST